MSASSSSGAAAAAAVNDALFNSNWQDVFNHVDPFAFASLGISLALALCVIGAAWCVSPSLLCCQR